MTLYRRDVLVARAPQTGGIASLDNAIESSAAADPHHAAAKIDATNALLEDEGLGPRPLITDRRTSVGDMTIIPTTVDAAVVRDTLKRLHQRGADVEVYGLDYQSVPGTPGAVARAANLEYYLAAGCKTGHGTAAWLPAPRYKMPDSWAWGPVPAGGRPVIALLDSGVEDHEWLPQAPADDPFLAEEWVAKGSIVQNDDLPYHGHGTFNAGLIHLTAPTASILPMRVMSDDGRVDDSKVRQALQELALRRAGGERVDVICMPFGRYRDEGADDDLDLVKDALKELRGVPIVASAGNDGQDKPMYPAAFATDPFLPDVTVISVGSKESPTERSPYSNFGVWVKEWRGGTNTLSLMPMPGEDASVVPKDGYAWWSGTSFAAVLYAAELVGK